ncbi:hypothetical protein MHZ92_11455 [Sporosarcina sp. ACRSL]|uniref:hypothetical protein n=1 Tax=Sporosarcina sp. ACRSL TaxID=2918215 RepID=UPI001EF407BD|nr:hypothetical protein [Sporosarcina sp. ACRSL]MCG7344754.1 hypothetical protein [Sporosarcina sp. ACRSL]
MKRFVNNLLKVLFFIGYLAIIHFFIWQHLPITTSTGVFVGTLLATLISLELAIITVNKLVDALRR